MVDRSIIQTRRTAFDPCHGNMKDAGINKGWSLILLGEHAMGASNIGEIQQKIVSILDGQWFSKKLDETV